MNNNSRSDFGKMGWVLIIYMCLTYFINTLPNSTLNVTSLMWEQMYGWSSTFVLSMVSVGGWIGVAFIFLFGRILAGGKLKLRPFILIDGIIMSVGLIFWGRTSSLAVLTFLIILIEVTYVLWGQLANQTLCNNWFPHKKGLAMGWATIGYPIGAGIGLMLFVKILGKTSISGSYMILGIVGIIIAVFGAVVFTEYPEQRGCMPDNDHTMTRERAEKELAEGREVMKNSPWTVKRMLTMKEVWMLLVGLGYMCLFTSGSMMQIVPRLVSMGYTTDYATTMMLVASVCAIPGSYLFGLLDSKIGAKNALMWACFLGCVSCFLYTINVPAALWIALVLIGAGVGAASNFVMSVTTSVWGRYHFQKAIGTILCITQLIGMSGVMLIAVLAEIFNYSIAYIILGALGLIAGLVVLPVHEDFARKKEVIFAQEDGKVNE